MFQEPFCVFYKHQAIDSFITTLYHLHFPDEKTEVQIIHMSYPGH